MDKIKVLVVDDGSSGGIPGSGASLPAEGVEVVGSLRIVSHASHAALLGSGAHPSLVAEGVGPVPAATGPARDVPEAPVYLTKTELDVLRLLARGQRNKDIAREMFISVNTVKTHVASIFRKLRVRNRSEAVRYVFSHGIR